MAGENVCVDCGQLDTMFPRSVHSVTLNTDDVVEAAISVLKRNPSGMTTRAIFNNIPSYLMGVPEDAREQEKIMLTLQKSGIVSTYTVSNDYSPQPILYWELTDNWDQHHLPIYSNKPEDNNDVYCPLSMELS